MLFILIAAAAGAGGAVGVILLIMLIVYIRSRVTIHERNDMQGVKWIDSIGIHFLTSKKAGHVAIVQSLLTFQNQVTYESFIKKWGSM